MQQELLFVAALLILYIARKCPQGPPGPNGSTPLQVNTEKLSSSGALSTVKTVSLLPTGSFTLSTATAGTRKTLISVAPDVYQAYKSALPDGAVNDMIVNQGFLYVCGDFTQIGGIAARGIARVPLNSTTWESLNTTTDTTSFERMAIVNGFLLAGGTFVNLQYNSITTVCNNVARINLSSLATGWQNFSIGANIGTSGGGVNAIVSIATDVAFIGGAFTSAFGSAQQRVTAATVSTGAGTLVTGLPASFTQCNDMLFESPSTILLAGRATSTTQNSLLTCAITGSYTLTASPFQGGATTTFAASRIWRILRDGTSLWVVGNQFTVGNPQVRVDNIARFDGSAWVNEGRNTFGSVRFVQRRFNGELAFGTESLTLMNYENSQFVIQEGTKYNSVGRGPNGNAFCYATLNANEFLIGTNTTSFGGVATGRLGIGNFANLVNVSGSFVLNGQTYQGLRMAQFDSRVDIVSDGTSWVLPNDFSNVVVNQA